MNEGRLPAGSEVAGYRIDEPLGRGGMGEVYRALDVRLGRPVALKMLAGALAADEDFQARLLHESRVAAGLDHPNVVPIYEAGAHDGALFIAMRYVPGRDLGALLRREGPLAPGRALAIAEQVAGALDAAHRRGLVHRDVKPGNVLVDREEGREHCYLADFGLTQSTSDHGPADGRLMGTVDYVSPEQIRGDPVDGRADQYSLACLLYECLSGETPHGRRSELAVIYSHLEEEPPPATTHRPELPGGIDAVLARGMAKDPDARFASCGELVEAARGALGLAAPAPRRLRRAALAAGAALIVAAAAVAVALLVGGGGAAAGATPPGALVRVDPRSGHVTARTAINGYPGSVATTPGGIWMADFRTGVLWRYQPGGGDPERITSNGEPRDVAGLGSKLYVAADGRYLSGVVSRYDAVTGVREEGVDLLACALASGEGVVWAAGCPAVQRLSTGEGEVRKLVERFLPFQEPSTVENGRAQFREMAIGAGSLWVLGDSLDPRMWRLDARTGRIEATIDLGFPPTSVAIAGGAAWVTDALDDRVVPIDVVTNRPLAPVRVGRGPTGVAAGPGGVWVANTLTGTISRIDPRRRRVVATVRVGGLPRDLAVERDAVWVTEHA
jgi:hypothetical protein